MAELRQEIDDDVMAGLTTMARDITAKGPFKLSRKSLINELLRISVRQYKAGTFDVTAMVKSSQDTEKAGIDLSSFGGKKFRPSAGQKKRLNDYALV